MKPSFTLTCETAEKIIKKSTAKIPPRFKVNMVIKSNGTYIARWINLDAVSDNENSVSDIENPNIAKAAYQMKGIIGFTAIWFNEDEDGKESIVVETLKAKDALKSFSDQKLIIIDVKA